MSGLDILIDRDQTIAARREAGYEYTRDKADRGPIVARFASPVTLYRVVDDRELRWAVRSGVVRGGMFSVPLERRYGASWATGGPKTALDPKATPNERAMLKDLVEWGRSWQGRLGKQLFLLEAPGEGRTFLHLGPHQSPRVDEDGPERVRAKIASTECNTGLGCSTRVPMGEVSVYFVGKGDKLVRLDDLQIVKVATKVPRQPIEIHPVEKDLAWSGQILGHPALITKDQSRYGKLWRVVFDESEVPMVDGATSPQAAAKAAAALLEKGMSRAPTRTVYVNKRPALAETLREGDVYESYLRERFRITAVGANHVELRAVDDKYHSIDIPLSEFFQKKYGFRKVGS